MKNKNSRILNFVKSPKIKNSRKFKDAKITRATISCVDFSGILFCLKLAWKRIYGSSNSKVNPFKPEFTIVIFIHYKPRIAVAILYL